MFTGSCTTSASISPLREAFDQHRRAVEPDELHLAGEVVLPQREQQPFGRRLVRGENAVRLADRVDHVERRLLRLAGVFAGVAILDQDLGVGRLAFLRGRLARDAVVLCWPSMWRKRIVLPPLPTSSMRCLPPSLPAARLSVATKLMKSLPGSPSSAESKISTGIPLSFAARDFGHQRRAVGRREQDAVDAFVDELLDDASSARRGRCRGRAFPDELDVELLGGLLGAAAHGVPERRLRRLGNHHERDLAVVRRGSRPRRRR